MTFHSFRYSNGPRGVSISARAEALTEDQLRSVVPSIFATTAHESRSDRFAPVATIDVLRGLATEGFDVFQAAQSRTRDESRAEFTKHMLRMRHRSLANAEGQAFEIVLINANDGTSSYRMIPGFFRFVCANGLMVGERFEEVRVAHCGNAKDQVIEGAYRVLEEAPKVTAQVAEFSSIVLGVEERQIFAEAAHQLRFDDAEKAPVSADQLLMPRRVEDAPSNLWTVMNVAQENIIRGGQRGWVRNEDGTRRRATTRAVSGIDQNRALNRALWTLTEKMAELKAR